ncbi:MAG TPA: AzlC family ABC transporter permease [Propionibacteriaceae bacterium]|nr:AzlC family ABC transporter permease [Propionibacteriaceae bacterium]
MSWGRSADAGEGVPADALNRGPLVRAAIGIGCYAAAFGATYGALSVSSGLTVGQTLVLSLVMFSGASQLAFVGVATGGGSAVAAVSAALLLGVRNAFYGVPLTVILAPKGWARLWTAHFVIDETTAMAVGQPSPRAQRYAFWATGLILFVLWQLGSLAGALLGAAVDTRALGLDAAAPAVYLALLWPGLRTAAARWVAVAGAAVALALIGWAPSGVPVIAAAGVALVAGWGPTSRRAVSS